MAHKLRTLFANGWRCRATVGVLALAGLSTVASGQDMQGFDPKAPVVPDFKLTPFYEAELGFVGKHVGDVIKKESIPAPAGAVAWRVMYVSRTWDDRLVPVTGIIVAPKGPSAKPRPILSWAHGTTGGARVCAPSLVDDPARDLVERSSTVPIDYGVPYLSDFLARGYVVVATDYRGLGGPGVHQYMVGNSAARNVLDIVRAARNLKELNAGNTFLTFGWSQGGHAAIFTGEEQPKYAAELHHLGVVAIAPGTTTHSEMINIPHLYVFTRSYRDAYYVPLTEFTDEGRKLIDAAADVCITGVYKESLNRKAPFFVGGWDPTMKKALAVNVPGNRKSAAPILVVHGTEDNVVAPEDTKQLLPRATKSGDSITVSRYQGKNHRTVIDAARNEILGWLDDRLSGKPVASGAPAK